VVYTVLVPLLGLFVDVRSAELRRARSSPSLTSALTTDEVDLLGRVSTRVHPRDAMYVPGQADHYLSVGLSARRVIDTALKSHSQPSIRSVLDFPCGYGRVLRFLRLMFPDARCTGVEIDPGALAFCRRAFGIETVLSRMDFGMLPLPRDHFDLIWCGSLLTHLDEPSACALLQTFHRCLGEDGLCVFTTHGRHSADWIRSGDVTYGLPAADQRAVLQQYDEGRYAYADLDGQPGYGISVVTQQHMRQVVSESGPWREVLFLERAWDNHQDVYALARR
jgi:SAM-dependent methyltransferase